MQTPLTFFFAFVVVLALIGAAAWLVRRFAGSRLGANTNRGRMPRLAVIDAAAVDGRRRLVLVRRDNVEHLLMIGGPTDIVVEPNIVRATAQRDQALQRAAVPSDAPPRAAALPDSAGWPEGDAARSDGFDFNEPAMPEPPSRAARPSFTDDIRRPSPSIAERRSAVERHPAERSVSERGDPMAGLVPEMGGRAEPRPEFRSEPPLRTPPRSEPMISRQATRPAAESQSKAPPVRAPERAAQRAAVTDPAADQNLAEMAQRLEAALRRPGGEPRPDNIAVPPAVDRVGAPPVAPEPPPGRPATEIATPATPPRSETPSAPAATLPAPKAPFENLEDEMASLLGRAKPPS